MSKAFTIIELIFVIVIIGILAAIAIPKLIVTRDAAKEVTELNNIANCIQDIASSYTAKSEEQQSPNCQKLKCATVQYGDLKDGNITVVLKNSSEGYPAFCDYVKQSAQKKNFEGNFSFSAIKVNF